MRFKYIWMVILLGCTGIFPADGQKRLIDYSTHEYWPYINEEKISDDGRYVSYSVGGMKLEDTLTVQTVDGRWAKRIPRGRQAVFTADSRFLVFTMGADSLGVLSTGGNDISLSPGVSAFKVPKTERDCWIAYERTQGKGVVLRNLRSNKEKRYEEARDYMFSEDGEIFLVVVKRKEDSITNFDLLWVDLQSGKEKKIWRGRSMPIHFAFSRNARSLAFIAGDKGPDRHLYFYMPTMDSADCKAGIIYPGSGVPYAITQAPLSFSEDGQLLFFKVNESTEEIASSKTAADGVTIWRYTDRRLQTGQTGLKDVKPDLPAVVDIASGRIQILDTGEDDPFYHSFSEGNNRKYMLASTNFNLSEMNNTLAGQSKIQLVFTADGKRVELKDSANLIFKYSFSSGGNYVIWWSAKERQFFTYDIRNGITRNITGKIAVNLYDELYDKPFPASAEFGIAGWLENDAAVLIYDRYDLWQVDPAGEKRPVNLTNGYGRRNDIVFRYVNTGENGQAIIKANTRLLLTAFNRQTKDNGFYNLHLPAKGDPEKLTMGPYIYYVPQLCPSSSFTAFSSPPQKAKGKDVYLVRRMSAGEAPNLFVTKDFRAFTPVTDIHPERQYKWLTSSLVNWQTFDGSRAQGILYKPENFDPSRKYPVIFYFYERLSDGLNNFLTPLLSEGTLLRMLPYFVSRGYLVFIPDIYYKIGAPGESAYNYVVSAADKLGALPFVDKTRMGMQGHSFGGYEVNYLVTRTSIFAAAASAAGASDYVSGYGSLFNNQPKQSFYEQGQSRIGATLWEHPDLYVRNSPVFGADKVSTPLLIMHNKNDEAVSWSQALEWFSALRRLDKKVWMLQYDGADHTIDDPQQQLDYSIRLAQFFDYYLKGTDPPSWMSAR